MIKKRIVFYSQHLVGVGHHFRNHQIISALTSDHDVYFVDGGRPVPGIALPASIQYQPLIPVFKDLQTGQLTSEKGNIQNVLNQRKQQLSELITHICPDIFIIEYFPFARWELADELLSTIQNAQIQNPKIQIICSVRDVPRRLPNLNQVFSTLNKHFSALFVHADPKLTRLEDHLPHIKNIQIPIHYTGYVAESLNDSTFDPPIKNYVLVSAGGGADGYDLIKPCTEAWQILTDGNSLKNHTMVIFTGPFMPQAQYDTLKKLCDNGSFQINRFTPHFLSWMKHADLSISRAGYNTCMNILETRTRSILIPGLLVSDQKFRAQRFSELGLSDLIHPHHLTPEKIAKTIAQTLSLPSPTHRIKMNGAIKTRDLINTL